MKNQILFTFLLFTLLFSSCAIYRPSNVDVPLIQEKGDTRIDASVATFPSITASVAHGLTDKIAFQVAGTLGINYDNHIQASLGRYFNVGNNNVFEIYGGAAYGYGQYNLASTPYTDLEGNYQNYFAQINYGKVAGADSNVEFGFGLKGGFLRTNLKDQNFYGEQILNPDIAPLIKTYNDNSILIEPVAMLRFGNRERLKFNAKLGVASIIKLTGENRPIPHERFNFSIGLNYRL